MLTAITSPAPHQRPWVLGLLFLAALLIRLYHANEPPLNFHATRQYRSLLIARSYYYESAQSVPEWKQDVARINAQRQGILEPPVMERLVSFAYRLLGGEQFWIARLFSTLFWLAGGVCLYQIAKVLADDASAFYSTLFYLFVPFGVVASRSFQPDPLMIMLILASIFSMLKYFERPGWLSLAVLLTLSATTIYIKPISLFVIYSAFLVVSIVRRGIRGSLSDLKFLLFFPITLLPVALFYVVGIFITGALREQARSSFLPGLLIDPFFWRGWLNNIGAVVGLAAFVAALLGVMLYRKGLPRGTMMGLWGGYVLFCLVFDYHIATHDYYHLQLIPITALSLGPMTALVANELLHINPEWYWRTAIWAFLGAGLVLSVRTTLPRLVDSTAGAKVAVAQEVGDRVQHETNTIYLASDYGLSLEYHGELSGLPWPLVSDLEWERLAGVQVRDAATRYRDIFQAGQPRYFIVMDRWEFDQQDDLKQFLNRNFPVLYQTDQYTIFDLRDE